MGEASKMEGFWYEHAYLDPAQVGATCQTLNASYDVATGTVTTDFSVMYGSWPFTIEEHYVPRLPPGARNQALYRKSVTAPYHLPGGGLLGLPSVIVTAVL